MPKKYDIAKSGDMRRLMRDITKTMEKEAKRRPVRVPVEVETVPGLGNGTGTVDMPENGRRGIAGSQSQAVRAALLDALLEKHESGDGRLFDVSDYVAELAEPLRSWAIDRPRVFGEMLSSQGLVNEARDLGGGFSVWLNDAGVSEAVAQRERRASYVPRQKAVREAVLLYVYEAEVRGAEFPIAAQVRDTHLGCYEGERIAEREVAEATLFLREIGLLKGQGAWGGGIVRPATTAEGKRLVEGFDGSIAEWENAKQGGIRVVNNNVTNHGRLEKLVQAGSISGPVSQSSESGDRSVDLAELVRQLRAGLPALPLDAEERQDFGQELERLDAESAKPEPNRRRVLGALGDIRDFLTGDRGEQAKALLPVVAAAIAAFGG